MCCQSPPDIFNFSFIYYSYFVIIKIIDQAGNYSGFLTACGGSQ